MSFGRGGVADRPVSRSRNRSSAQQSFATGARGRRLAVLLFASTALAVFSFPIATPALADGGAGGSGSNGTGGTGGTDSSTGAGGTGGDSSEASTGTDSGGAGGGGGAGVTGGAGGHGASNDTGAGSGAGGAGGATAGASGSDGQNGVGEGAGGGGGGAHGYVGSTLPTGAVSGGNGGDGGDSTGGSGGGGAGGYGAVVTGTGLSGTITDDITGGRGGRGGYNVGNDTSEKGAGGSGGLGLQFTGINGNDVTIDATISGGNGGSLQGGPGSAVPAGDGGTGIDLGDGNTVMINGSVTGGNGGAKVSAGVAGAGGAGLIGENADVTVSSNGSVTGGAGGSGGPQANAITFTGGTNSLTLESGATISGAVAAAGSDALKLNGSADDILDTSLFTGFSSLAKSGAGTWTITGSGLTGGTTITAGTLSIGAANNIGSGAVSLNGGTLETTNSFSLSHTINVTAPGGGIDTGANTLTLTGVLGESNSFAKTGAGTLVFGSGLDASGHSGGMTLQQGTLRLEGDLAADFGTIVTTGSVMDYANGVDIAAAINLDSATTQLQVTTGTATQSGDISESNGPRPLEKTGSGTLVLSGTNTFTGPFAVSAGTLGLENGDAVADTVAVTVATSANLIVTHTETIGSLAGNGDTTLNAALTTGANDDSTTYSGGGTGTGSLIKVGSGRFELSGSSDYAGPTTVSGGTLAVNGSIVSDVTVEDGATLAGVGSVGGVSILSGGIYAPGNSIGTQSVNGPVSFAAGSFFDVEVDDAGNSDKIEATGTAMLDGGTVRVMAQAGTYNPLTDYTILTAGGGVAGTFDDVTSDMAFLTPFLSYDPNAVYLQLIRNDIVLADEADTPNQRAVAEALGQFALNDPLYLAVLVQSADGARQAFDALSGEVHTTLPGILINDSRYVRDAILSRLRQASHSGGGASSAVALLAGDGPTVAALGGGSMMGLGMGGEGSAAPAYGSGLAFWTQGFGAWGDFDGNGNAASADRTTGGFLSGVDAGLGGGWRAGLAAGYSQSDISVDARLSSADVESYHVAGYAGGRVGGLALRAGGAWTWHDIDTARAVVFPGFAEFESASYDGDTGQVFAEAALPMGIGDTAIEPFAGIAYVHVNTGGFTESSGVAALTAAGSDEDVGYSTLGLRAAATMRVDGVQITPRASIAWQHAFGDVNPDLALAFNSNGIGFGISGVPIARDSALVEAGLGVAVAPNATLGVSYQGQLASDVQDHGVTGRLDWRF